MDVYYTKAIGGFERFANCWDFKDFWTRGNTFDALLGFVSAAEKRWPGDPAVEKMSQFRSMLIKENSLYFNDNVQGGWWADDYGWWGMACLRAYDHLSGTNQGSAATYLEYAKLCWQKMCDKGYDASSTARPVPHGCANSGEPAEDGTKNTVTNANLFLLSLRLYVAVKDTDRNAAAKYLKMAYAQYIWFSSWFSSPSGYLRTFPGPFGLAQERPIAAPSYENKTRPTWENGWVWSGDQGLLLAALAEIYAVRNELPAVAGSGFDTARFAAEVQNAFVIISTGVKILLWGAPDQVLREAPFNSSFVDDPNDYVCGRGVLLRYLSEPSVQRMLQQPLFSEGIAATAQAVWNSRNPQNNQFAAGWTDGNDQEFNARFINMWGAGDVLVQWPETMNDGVKQAAGLDVLTAAILS